MRIADRGQRIVDSGLRLLGVGLVALLLRCTYVWEIAHAPFFDLRLGDAQAYHEWATRIASGEWLGHDVFYQAPLYPYFLAVVYRTLGDSTTIVRVVQAVMGALSCMLLAATATSIFGRAGVLAGLLLAIYPAAIYFDGLLEKTSLVIFLTTALLALIAAAKGNTPRRWIAAGSVLGPLALTRENALLLAPVIVTWACVASPGESRRVRLTAPLLFLAGLLLVLVPVGVRNLVAGGEFHLTTSQLGPNYYIGNHAGASGTYDALVTGHGSAADEREDATKLAEQALGTRLSPSEVSAYWVTRALAYVREHPAEWLGLMGRKLALTFNTVEIADTESRDVYADWSLLLRVLSPFGFAVVLGLATFGTLTTASMWPRIWWLYGIAATYTLSVTMFYVLERYRIPVVPVLMVLAAGALGEGVGLRTHARRTAAALAVALVVAASAYVPLADERTARATHYSAIAGVLSRNPDRIAEALQFYEYAIKEASDSPAAQFGMGTVLSKMGRPDEATQYLRSAVASRPDYAEAHYNLGLALAATDRLHEAVEEYGAALRLRPADADTRLALAKAYLTLEQPARAAGEYQQVLEIYPDTVRALIGLGVALTQMGQVDDALSTYRRALAIDPNEPDVHNNIGFTLAQSGHVAEAVPHFERALSLNPRDENARRNLERARQLLKVNR